MLRYFFRSCSLVLSFFLPCVLTISLHAQHKLADTANTNAPSGSGWKQGELAIKNFELPAGLKVDLWAAEPLLVNPVAFNFDEHGRAYVCETFRLHAGVGDIPGVSPEVWVHRNDLARAEEVLRQGQEASAAEPIDESEA